MLFEKKLIKPDAVILECEDGFVELDSGCDNQWWGKGSVVVELNDGKLSLKSPDKKPMRLQLIWKTSFPSGTRFLNDHWERGYGDMHWGGLGSERRFPWYFMAFDGKKTFGCGVKVRPNSLCHWLITSDELRLICDLRNGVKPLNLGARELIVAEILTSIFENCTPYSATCEFCKSMCDDPIKLQKPVYGFNDWYYAYGMNSRETVLRDADILMSLTEGNEEQPYLVIDAGWQVIKNICAGGPWQSNRMFGDMASLADEMKKRGTHPGIWIRPLLTHEKMHSALVAGCNQDGELILDPSNTEVLQIVRENVSSLHDWGFEMIKHDFTTFDITGLWGFEMMEKGDVYGDEAVTFHDDSRTTAEIILELYQTIREAAGDSLIIGCNTIGHLAAGLVDLQRTGDDTSGKEWARTRKMGVNTLAFRMPQHNAFFAADADCVGLTNEVPWNLNSQWLDVLANSGTPLFVSADPNALGLEQKDALKKAFKKASEFMKPSEPLDWLDTTTPSIWKTEDGEKSYDWFEK